MVQTKSGKDIPEFKWNVDAFLKKTTVLYGPSKSGKSQLVKTIMKLLRPYIDQVLVFSPTERLNHSYDGIVDPTLIHYKIEYKDPNAKRESENNPLNAAIRHLDLIWERQEMMADIYSKVTNLNTLESLYKRLPSDERRHVRENVDKFNTSKEKIATIINHQYAYEPIVKKSKLDKLEEKFKDIIVQVHIKAFKDNYEYITKQKNLNENEKYAMDYLSINPNLLLIFDDCAADYGQLFKKDIMKRYFYQNRHGYVTVIITCQADKDIIPPLRKNAFISIYTDSQCAINSFNDSSNKYPKETKKFVEEATEAIFSEDHRKLVYIRDDDTKQKYYWVKALYPLKSFKFGSQALHELCNIVRKNNQEVNKNNKFYSHFKIN